MRTILALCFLLVFTSIQCTFTPDWKACDNPKPNGWRTVNVTLDSAPIAGQNSTFTICGQNTKYYELKPTDIHVTSGTVLDLTFPQNGDVWYLVCRCFDVNFEIPKGNKAMEIDFVLSGMALKDVGCVNVTLHLGSEKFLGNTF